MSREAQATRQSVNSTLLCLTTSPTLPSIAFLLVPHDHPRLQSPWQLSGLDTHIGLACFTAGFPDILTKHLPACRSTHRLPPSTATPAVLLSTVGWATAGRDAGNEYPEWSRSRKKTPSEAIPSQRPSFSVSKRRWPIRPAQAEPNGPESQRSGDASTRPRFSRLPATPPSNHVTKQTAATPAVVTCHGLSLLAEIQSKSLA